MDTSRGWDRILEVVRILADQHDVPVPEPLIRISGNYWERDAARRTALNQFLAHVPELPEFSFQQSLAEIADVLDMHILKKDAHVLNEGEDDAV